MSSTTLTKLNELSELCDNAENIYMATLYRKLSCYSKFIKENISSELYDEYSKEMDCLNYESFLGDSQNSHLVLKDCIDIIRKIIKIIKEHIE
jgi:hypothetical protein